MQSADLLALAASAAQKTAPKTAPAAPSFEDAEAFARAMQADADPRCGTTGAAAAAADGPREAGADWVRPEGAARPERAAFGAWRDFLQGLRENGLLAGWRQALTPNPAAGAATAKPAADATTALVSQSGTSTPKPALDAAAAPFVAALDALGAAIQAALQNPAANPAEPGQLPPAVQTALDAAVAVAPPALQPRLQAFATRLTERLAAAMAGADGEGEGEAAAAAGAADKPARPAQSVAQAVLAALGQTGLAQTPVMPELETREARAAAAPLPEARVPTEAAAEPALAAPSSATAPSATDARAAPPTETAEPLTTTAAAVADEATPRTEAASAAPAAAPAAATDAHAATLAAVRGSPELVAQMAATISRKLDGRITRFNMELNPAELGRVDVRLSIDKDGRVAAQMAFDNPVAAADMRGRADELRRQLEQSGFQVASEDLTFTDRETGQGFDRNARGQLADPDVARDRAFREAERTARLAEDAGRLQNRAVIGLDMRV